MRYKIIILFALYLNYSFAQKYTPTYFPKKDFIEDVHFLKGKVFHIHPIFFESKFAIEWNKQYNQIIDNCQSDSITFNECYIYLSSLLSKLQDGHTNFSFPYSERIKYMKNGGTTMPFTITIKNSKIFFNQYFANTKEANISAYEIVSINNISSDSILKRLQPFYGAKNKSITNSIIEKYFGAYFWTVFGEFPQYNVEVLKNGKIKLLELKPVNNSEYFALKNKKYPKLKEEKYKISFWDKNNFAYLKIKSFADKKTLSVFIKEAFDTIKTVRCKNLIIDIRNNFGGTSDAVDTLLSYLTNKPYKQYLSIGLRTSDDIKLKYKNTKPELYNKISHLSDTLFYYTDSMLLKEPCFRKNKFTGNIFVLVNTKTFSAASTFAGIMKQYKLGKIIGESGTGGTIKYYGDFLFFKLPNTKMDFFISTKQFIQFGGNNLNKGVYPDILVKKNNNIKEIINELKTNANNGYKQCGRR